MKQWKRVSGVVLSGILALSMTLGGMTAPDAGAKAKKAKLKTKKISVTVGKKKTIKIANKKKSCKYTFKSNKKKVAKVSKKGVVTGQKKGTAKITVKEVKKNGKSRKLGTVKVTVTRKKGPDKNVVNTTKPTAKATAKATEKPNPAKATPTPVVKGTSVKVYTDEIKDSNLVAEADGFGHMPTPEPTKSADATPEPTPAVLVNADMEKGEYEPIASRGSASVSVVDDGANNTKKSAKVTGRTADWHGASIDVSSLVETDNEYAISFYAKQETGEDQKLDLSMQYVGDDESTHYDSITSVELSDSTWTKCEATMKVPEHTGTILIYWQSVYQSNNDMDFYLDEVTKNSG